jgi:Trk-type K+ transport system membrane component
VAFSQATAVRDLLQNATSILHRFQAMRLALFFAVSNWFQSGFFQPAPIQYFERVTMHKRHVVN